MKKNVFLQLILIIFTVYSLPVDKITAEQVARNWLNGKSENKAFYTVSEYVFLSDMIHVFNFTEGGWILIAGDDASVPVLGYSFTGKFGKTEDKQNIDYWINKYKTALTEIETDNLSNQPTVKKWNDILSDKIIPRSMKNIEPLLKTTWNQNYPYNIYCPIDGNGEISVTGCAATALVQIMKYHSHPLHGYSESSYYCEHFGVNETLSANYLLSTYNWDRMPDHADDSSSSIEKHEVAQISYHAGVALEMMYSSMGSSAPEYGSLLPLALRKYFRYDNSVALYYRSDYSTTTWKEMMIENLDNALPIYYLGNGNGTGHAFVCDGFQTSDYFHFNWGWGGALDGYFYIDELNPYENISFNEGQNMLKDIKPSAPDLVLDRAIEDIITNENEIIINLNDYFHSNLGYVRNYSLHPSSELNGLTYTITDSILTFTKTANNLSKIIVLCSNRYDEIFDDFSLRFGPLPASVGFGNTYNLNGESIINAGNDTVLNSMELISISMWIKLNRININHGLISKSNNIDTGWYLQVQSNNLIKFFVKTQDGYTRRIYSETTLEANRWYHLAVVFDGKDFVMYLDGEFENEKTSYTSTSIIEHDTEEDLIIGQVHGMNLDGTVDEVCIWDKPKSLDSFRTILETQPSVSDQDLISYWNLDEGMSSDIFDLTNINNAEIEDLNPEYWTKSTVPVKYFIARNINAAGSLPGDKGPGLTYSVINNGTIGTMSILDIEEGTFEYIPDPDITGVDTLSYQIDDGSYRSEIIDIIIDIKDQSSVQDKVILPETAILYQNYPNPFNPQTTISFAINEQGPVKLVVYDINGSTVANLVNGIKNAGIYQISWNGKNNLNESVASGIYYYMLKTNNFTDIKKALLIK